MESMILEPSAAGPPPILGPEGVAVRLVIPTDPVSPEMALFRAKPWMHSVASDTP